MSRQPSTAQAALAIAVGAACAGATWFGMSALAAPAAFEARRAELEATVARLEQAAAGVRRSSVHGGDGACPGLDDGDVGTLKQGVATLAAQSGVTLTDLVAAPPSDLAGHGRLAPVALRLQAIGPYETIREFLERLAEAKPELFVDALDLTSAAPDVKLKLTGKVFCWTSARR